MAHPTEAPQPPTLRQLLDNYEAPDFNPLYLAPQLRDLNRNMPAKNRNTSNKKYPISTIQSVQRWHVTRLERDRYQAMLDTPYDVQAVAQAAIARQVQLQPQPAATDSDQENDEGNGGDNGSSDSGVDGSNREVRQEEDDQGHREEQALDTNEPGDEAPLPTTDEEQGAEAELLFIADEEDAVADAAEGDDGNESDGADQLPLLLAPRPPLPPPINGQQAQQAAADKLAEELQLLRGLPDRYPIPFRMEAALTSRLDGSVLSDLVRIQRWTMHKAATTPGWLPDTHVLLVSEPGSAARLNGKFLPDRCAVWEEGEVDQTNYCPGDIKPSYKFQSSWSLYLSNRRLKNSAFVVEYKKVLAQLKFYMEQCSFVPPNRDGVQRAATYGYIITDEEVVLVKRHQTQRGGLMVTHGFKWRLGDRPRAASEWSAMRALVQIHWMASDNGRNTVLLH